MAKQMVIEANSKFLNNSKRIKVGNIIKFQRRGFEFEGEVTKILEMSVIVAVNPLSAPFDLVFENDMTVVNHGKYQIIQST